jgi:hypothetical protein
MTWWVWMAVALVLGACATTETSSPPTLVPVTDVKSLAGRWEGLLLGLPGGSHQDFVEVVIREDGTYQARTYRTIGVLMGRGTIEARDGALVLRGERAIGGGRLYLDRGRHMLEISATDDAGRPVTARLSPAR